VRQFVFLMGFAALAACQPQQKGLTAKELFELRSECGAYVSKWEADIPTGEWGAHYDPKSNRCFLENISQGTDFRLYDPQSNALLAMCTLVTSINKTVCVVHDKDTPSEQAMKYITDSMAD
jgi:hypothetical protein